jgi:PAS domain S-box-containing protein
MLSRTFLTAIARRPTTFRAVDPRPRAGTPWSLTAALAGACLLFLLLGILAADPGRLGSGVLLPVAGLGVALLGTAVFGLRRREAELAASGKRYRALAETSPDALLISDRGRIAWVNPAGARLLGAGDPDALLGRATLELVHPACRGPAEKSFRRATGEVAAPPLELRLVRLDGGEVSVEARAAALPSEDGTAIVLSLRERAAHQATALALQESEARFRALAEATGEAVMIHDHGRIVEVNDAFCTLFGYTREQAIGLDPRAVVAPAARADALVPGTSGHAEPCESLGLRRDGTVFPIELCGKPSVYRGRPMRVGLVQDITARKAVEAERDRLVAELAAERAYLESILAQMPSGLAIAEAPSGRLLLHNDRAVELLRHPMLRSADHGGYAAYGALHDDGSAYAPEEYPIARAARRGEVVRHEEMDYRRGDGTLTRFVVNAVPVRDVGGRIIAAVSTFEDIGARRRQERALAESEQRLRLALDAGGMGTFVWDIGADRFEWDAAQCALFDIPGPSAMLRADEMMPFLHPDDRARVWRSFGQALETGQAFAAEFRIRRPDGEERWIAARGAVVHDASARPVAMHGVNFDITERKRHEQALVASEERLKLAAQVAGFGTYDVDLGNDTVVWSAELYAIFGLTPDTALSLGLIKEFLHPEDRERVMAAFLAERAETDGGFAEEYRIVRPDGGLRWLQGRGHTLYAGEGAARRPVRALGAAQDITARKEAEQRQALLVRELNHRVKNILAVTQGVAHLTAAAAGSLDEFRRTFHGRLQALAVANELLAGGGWQATRLGAVLERALRPHGVQDETRFELHVEDMPLSSALTQDLALALHELATNAAKYGALSAPEGRVVIRAGRVQSTGPALRLVWCELGGPPVATPAHQGFGTKLLHQLVRQQRGQIEQDWRADGLVCTVELPLKEDGAGQGAYRAPPAA